MSHHSRDQQSKVRRSRTLAARLLAGRNWTFSFRHAEKEDDQMPTENLSELLGRVSENSASQIDDLVGDFGRLKERLRADGEASNARLGNITH